jgi:hypothetical protein
VKFQQALPFCVFPVSSQLAALHAVSQSCPVPDSCKSCGSYLSLSTHVTVVRNRQHSRVITSSCNACGRIHSTPLHKGSSTTFPPRKRRPSTFHTPSNPIPDIALQASFASTSATSSTKPIKPLSTKENNKKFRLRDMLKKNREKEQRRSNMPETSSGGLSAFLSTL